MVWTYPFSNAPTAPSFCWQSRQETSCRMHPRNRVRSDDWGICFFSEEMLIRLGSTLSQPAAIEYELDSFAQSFSQAASELEQRAHWHRTAGRVRWERSIVRVLREMVMFVSGPVQRQTRRGSASLDR